MNFAKNSFELNPSEKFLYYDMVVSNSDSEMHENVKQLMFEDKRDTNILNDISEYKLSVIRFSLSTWCLPLSYFQPRKNSNDPDEGIYSVTLEYNDNGNLTTGTPKRVMFIPQDKTKQKPQPPNTFPYGISLYDQYYYIYNYENFIDMVNTTLQTAFTELQGLVVGGVLDQANPPKLIWDSNAQSAILYTEKDYYDISQLQHIKIFFNRPLYSLFNSFPSYKYLPTTDGKHYQILTNSYGGLNCVSIPTFSPSVLIKTEQEFSTIESWTYISSILFTTNMPIISTDLSNPTIYENGVQLFLSDKHNQSQQVLADFQSSENNYRSTLYYVPAGENRYISFKQNHLPLKNIVIWVYIKDRYGILRPFEFPSNSTASLKILFERIN